MDNQDLRKKKPQLWLQLPRRLVKWNSHVKVRGDLQDGDAMMLKKKKQNQNNKASKS